MASGHAVRGVSTILRTACLAAAVAALQAVATTAAAADGAEIRWDELGIPHIYGPDLPTVVRGFGYAQMENHAETILGNVAQARGRLAEYFGAGAGGAYVASDVQVRTFGIPQRSARWLREGGSEQRALLEAFAAGVNEYAQRHGDTIDPSFLQVLPIVPEDILDGIQYTITFTFQSEQSGVPQLLSQWQQGAIAAGAPAATSAVALLAQAARNGSNGWAIAPARSASGNAILMGNPHLPWGNNQPIQGLGIYQWMEAQLVVGERDHPRLNATGAVFVGGPFLGIAYTDDLGWTHTNNTIKNADLYELTLTGTDTYLWDGGSRPFEHRADSLRIRQPDGSFATQAIDVVSSVHGPVIAQRGTKALALRVAGLDAPALTTEYFRMLQAHDLPQFIEANSALQMPFFNVIYADRGGHIMYLFGGRQPVRSGGTFYDWIGILPGDRPSALWTRTLSWGELPRTIDPPGGFVQNGNDAPWSATFPQVLRYQDYPAWIAPLFTELRPQHNLLYLLSRPKFTADEILHGKMSTKMELAARVLPDLIAAARNSGDATAAAAATVLAAWDYRADATSRGAALFERWWTLYAAAPGVAQDTTMFLYFSHPAFRIGWNPADPLHTPVGLAETTVAVQSLITAAQQVVGLYGALDVAWGDVHRTVLATHDATMQQVIPVSNDPESGPDDVYGPIRTVWPFPAPDGQHAWAYGGDGYVQLVEFTPQGVKARALLTYGNASRPGSSHVTDQLPWFDRKELRPVWRTPAEVDSHTVTREPY
ncbi:MAG TPA: penicillin acylase family protein [Burkholderiaceae bacterium]|nr:penicillin acylase family protein [Burkholderiaceae bacterium]